MRLLAAGFNAHSQLLYLEDTKSDTHHFTQVLTGRDIQILFAGWSETLGEVAIQETEQAEYALLLSGNENPGSRRELNWEQDNIPACAFGTHDSLLGCISYAGDLFVMVQGNDDEESDLIKITKEDGPRVRHLAIDGTGKVCVIPLLSPGSTTLHPLEFECFGTARRLPGISTGIEKPPETKSFLSWFLDPTDPDRSPLNHHMLPGPCKKLVANAITFSLLNTAGQLFTWGDGRYPSAFGRPITSDAPANMPHLVSVNVQGTKINAVASGGTVTAVETDHHNFALIWGTHVLGGTQEQIIQNLQSQSPGEASLVQFGAGSDAFPASVTAIAVGDGHVLAVDDRRNLWATGRNDYGQLGLGEDSKKMVQEWKKVELDLTPSETIWKVACGELTSFVLVA